MKDATHNRDHFNGANKVPCVSAGKYRHGTFYELNQDWSIKNSISCPVDKLAGVLA